MHLLSAAQIGNRSRCTFKWGEERPCGASLTRKSKRKTGRSCRLDQRPILEDNAPVKHLAIHQAMWFARPLAVAVESSTHSGASAHWRRVGGVAHYPDRPILK